LQEPEASDVGLRITSAIEDDSLEVPMLPQVVSELLTMLHDPDASASKLSALLHKDQGLAALVLRVAGSPLYASGTQIVSLQQAIARIGLHALAELVVASGVGAKVFRAEGQTQRMRALWRTSLTSGLFAKEIARVGRKNVESAFLCGLLHDVGSPIVIKLALTEARRLKLCASDLDLEGLVRSHSIAAGLALARRWVLPPQVGAAIEYAQCRDAAPAHRYEVQVTCLAAGLANFYLRPGEIDEQELREHPVFADLNFYPSDVDALLAKSESVLSRAELFNA